ALPMLGGGVSFGDFALLVLALSNLAFFTAALGLYVSAKCWDEKRAATVTTITLLGLAVLLPCLVTASRVFAGWGPSLGFFYGVSPAYAVWQATVTGCARLPAFWWSVLLTHSAGWFFFRATCRV